MARDGPAPGPAVLAGGRPRTRRAHETKAQAGGAAAGRYHTPRGTRTACAVSVVGAPPVGLCLPTFPPSPICVAFSKKIPALPPAPCPPLRATHDLRAGSWATKTWPSCGAPHDPLHPRAAFAGREERGKRCSAARQPLAPAPCTPTARTQLAAARGRLAPIDALTPFKLAGAHLRHDWGRGVPTRGLEDTAALLDEKWSSQVNERGGSSEKTAAAAGHAGNVWGSSRGQRGVPGHRPQADAALAGGGCRRLRSTAPHLVCCPARGAQVRGRRCEQALDVGGLQHPSVARESSAQGQEREATCLDAAPVGLQVPQAGCLPPTHRSRLRQACGTAQVGCTVVWRGRRGKRLCSRRPSLAWHPRAMRGLCSEAVRLCCRGWARRLAARAPVQWP